MNLTAGTPVTPAPGPLAGDASSWLRHTFAAPAPPLSAMLMAAGMAHVCGLLTPLGYQVVFDRVFSQGVEATLVVVVVALLGLALLEGGCQGLRARSRLAWGEGVDARLRPGLIARLVQQGGERELGTPVLEEAARLRAGVCGPLTDALLDLPLLLLLHAVLVWLSPPGAAVALLMGAVLLTVHRLGAAAAAALPAREAALRDVHLLARSLVEGASAWRALRVAPSLVERFAAADLPAREVTRLRELAAATGRERMQTLLRLQAVLLLGVGAHEVLAGRLSGGGLVACNLLTARMAQPWTRLLAGLDALPQVRRSRGLLLSLLRGPVLPVVVPAGVQEHTGDGGAQVRAGRLVFEAFAPAGEAGARAPALLSGHWPEGARIVLSTDEPEVRARAFAACLGETPHRGGAWIEGGAGCRTPLARVAVGLVGELRLLPGSLRLNLALHEPALEDACLRTAIEDAGLADWFGRLPAALESVPDAAWPLRDAAFRLRLGLARALVRGGHVLVWELAPADAREAQASGLFEQLARRRSSLTLIVVGGDPGVTLQGFHRHRLSGAGSDADEGWTASPPVLPSHGVAPAAGVR